MKTLAMLGILLAQVAPHPTIKAPIVPPTGSPQLRYCQIGPTPDPSPAGYEILVIDWRQPRGVGDAWTGWSAFRRVTSWAESPIELPTFRLALAQIRYRYEDTDGVLEPTPWVWGEVSACAMK